MDLKIHCVPPVSVTQDVPVCPKLARKFSVVPGTYYTVPGVLVLWVAAVYDDVALLEEGDQLVDEGVHGTARLHQDHHSPQHISLYKGQCHEYLFYNTRVWFTLKFNELKSTDTGMPGLCLGRYLGYGKAWRTKLRSKSLKKLGYIPLTPQKFRLINYYRYR